MIFYFFFYFVPLRILSNGWLAPLLYSGFFGDSFPEWRRFMNTPKVKLLYKTLNEFGVLIVLIWYSLLGQPYANEDSDRYFIAAVSTFVGFHALHLFYCLYTIVQGCTSLAY